MTDHDDIADITDKLIKLCGMFGSAPDGERAAAATMADRLLRETA